MTDEAGLAVSGLHVRAGAFHLGEIDLALDPGRVLVVLGPSGAGKTTMLDAIAGFRRPSAGSVRLDGREIAHLPPEDRRIGVVFQHYALFPHLSVAENVRFGPRALGIDDAHARRALLERVGIAHLADRRPGTLSGGERQRVALARALAIRPRLLLLDEPLSALDAPTRDELRGGLRELLHDLGIPTVYVTHDQTEATAIGDDVAVLMEGRLRQVGPADDVLRRPRDLGVALFLGLRSLGPVRREGAAVVVGPAELPLLIAGAPPGEDALAACYRPSDVELLPAGAGDGDGRLEAPVAAVRVFGDLTRVELGGTVPLTAVTLTRTARELGLAPGGRATARIPPDALRLVVAE